MDSGLASGALLAQLRPGDTLDQALFSASLGTEVTAIAVCNTTGSAATFRLFHDQGGSSYDQGNALYYDKSVPANDTFWVKPESVGAGIQMDATDTLGCRTGTASALTFTVYGVTESVAERQLLRAQH